jgi:hypothetical protein
MQADESQESYKTGSTRRKLSAELRIQAATETVTTRATEHGDLRLFSMATFFNGFAYFSHILCECL